MLSQEVVNARIKGETNRTIGNILARTELPKQQWWLSFAGKDGFHGVCIVHAEDFTTAVMEANLNKCNPHGQCQGVPLPPELSVPQEWTYRILSRKEAGKLDTIITPK